MINTRHVLDLVEQLTKQMVFARFCLQWYSSSFANELEQLKWYEIAMKNWEKINGKACNVLTSIGVGGGAVNEHSHGRPWTLE